MALALPPAHMLVGAACAELVRGPTIGRWRAWGVAALVAVLADVDSAARLWLGQGAASHGLFTHSAVAVLTVALAAGAIGGRRWALIVGAAYASHLLVDLLREGATTSVYLFWPLSTPALPPLAPVFPNIPFEADSGLWPPLELHGPRPLRAFFWQTSIGLGVLAAAVAGKQWLERRPRPRSGRGSSR